MSLDRRGPASAATSFILQAHDVSKSFKEFKALTDVNLNVRENTLHALIGPNGAGKTTLFNMLSKFLAPSSGEIFYRGERVTHLSAADMARNGVVRSFQISSVFPSFSVLENVRIALQQAQGKSLSFWRPGSSLRELDPRAEQLLDSVGLLDFCKVTASELSYGRRRTLELATTLALDPKVVLLDEPMAGIGREDIDRMANLIKTMASSRTIVMVEHNLSVVADLSDTITVLAGGHVLAEGDYDTISRDRSVRQAYIGTSHA